MLAIASWAEITSIMPLVATAPAVGAALMVAEDLEAAKVLLVALAEMAGMAPVTNIVASLWIGAQPSRGSPSGTSLEAFA